MTYLGGFLMLAGLLVFGVAMLVLALGIGDPVPVALSMAGGLGVGAVGAYLVGDA